MQGAENDLLGLFEGVGKLYTEQRELAAIWLEKPVMTSEGRKIRICEGMEVFIQEGELKDLPAGEEPTHKILMCLGTLTNQFQLVLVCLKTNQPITINL